MWFENISLLAYNIGMNYNSNANPFLSRKTYNCVCEWWGRSTFNGQLNLAKIAYTQAPSGAFHAKAVSQFMLNKKNESDIRLSNGYVTIETPDDVSFIRPDDIVRFQGIMYRVLNIARREVSKTREFMKNPVCVFVLNLGR